MDMSISSKHHSHKIRGNFPCTEVNCWLNIQPICIFQMRSRMCMLTTSKRRLCRIRGSFLCIAGNRRLSIPPNCNIRMYNQRCMRRMPSSTSRFGRFLHNFRYSWSFRSYIDCKHLHYSHRCMMRMLYSRRRCNRFRHNCRCSVFHWSCNPGIFRHCNHSHMWYPQS